ncbi:MAG TPA: HEPN domain-containing protein [Thermodesulfobacteriota bacterium]|nr:HEPN domain-containing protein [Thermodesulfobacteriota bacterium]
MNNINMAEALFKDASDRLIEAEENLKDGKYHRAVRSCVESVEIGLKALFYYLSIDFPKEHDVGKFFDSIPEVKNTLTVSQRRKIRKINRNLAKHRVTSFYGDPSGIPPSAIFSKKQAEEAIDGCKYVLEAVTKITQGMLKGK